MGVFRTRTWILLASLVASLHLTPGIHELSHDGHAPGSEASHAAEVSAAETECDVCALLSGARFGLVAAPAQAGQPLAAVARLETLPAGPRIASQLHAVASPRAPPAA